MLRPKLLLISPHHIESEVTLLLNSILLQVSQVLYFCLMNENHAEGTDELDALIAAPEHHKLLFENQHVRVLDTLIQPGEITNLHVHRHPASLYILSWSDFIRYDAEGHVMADSRKLANPPVAHSALWSEPLVPHQLKNIGTEKLHVISVEIKI